MKSFVMFQINRASFLRTPGFYTFRVIIGLCADYAKMRGSHQACKDMVARIIFMHLMVNQNLMVVVVMKDRKRGLLLLKVDVVVGESEVMLI